MTTRIIKGPPDGSTTLFDEFAKINARLDALESRIDARSTAARKAEAVFAEQVDLMITSLSVLAMAIQADAAERRRVETADP